MASMPHFLSAGVNDLAATGIEKAVNGLMSMLSLTVTGVEEIVVFYINMLTSTYLCLITFAVSGSLHAAIEIIESASTFINKSLATVESGISDGVASFDSAFDAFISDINSVTSTFGSSLTIPSIDLNSSVDALKNFVLPSDLDSDLQTLNASIPTFAQVKNFTDNAIRFPFEEIKDLINSTMVGYQFDRSVLPTPDKEALIFCSDNNSISDFFAGLYDLVELAKKIFIGVLLALALLVMVPMAWREIRRWRTMQDRALLVQEFGHDPLDVVYLVSRPYTSTAGIKMANRFRAPRKQTLVRWVFAYATSEPALFVLCLALAGLFSAACQALLLRAIQHEVPKLTNEVSDFANKIVSALSNVSEEWATDVNGVIDSTNSEINTNLLGWVNTSTTALNDTLNTFVDEMTTVLNETFGGTILYDPITEVLNCLITLKIQGIESGLTWIHDNAHVDFPHVANTTFSLGAADSISDNSTSADSFLASAGDDASDEVSAAVDNLVSSLMDGIRTEALIATGILAVYFTVVFSALFRAATLWFKRDKNRGEGGATQSNPDPGPDGNGFDNIPLQTPTVAKKSTKIGATRLPPAPRYSLTVQIPRSNDPAVVASGALDRSPAYSVDDPFADSKVGFAGQRDYEDALRGDGKGGVQHGGHVRSSSYGEMGYPEEKAKN